MGTFSKATNVGAHLENGVVYASDSYIPRNIYANMSMHLFGHSINFFEIGARAQGLDGLIGSFVGPDSMFSQDSNEESTEYDQVTSDSSEEDNIEDRTAFSAYVRIFGDEIAYGGIDDYNFFNTLQTEFKKKVPQHSV